ncbi:MAG: DUF1064 domain-containing protein [Nanoarchaeota archaeon]
MRFSRYNKYKNIRTKYDGINFASKKEKIRYQELKLLEKASKIEDLELQPEFTLQIGFTDRDGNKHRPIVYRADFTYLEEGSEIVEDCKGVRTEVYKIKKKMLLYNNRDLIFREV